MVRGFCGEGKEFGVEEKTGEVLEAEQEDSSVRHREDEEEGREKPGGEALEKEETGTEIEVRMAWMRRVV